MMRGLYETTPEAVKENTLQSSPGTAVPAAAVKHSSPALSPPPPPPPPPPPLPVHPPRKEASPEAAPDMYANMPPGSLRPFDWRRSLALALPAKESLLVHAPFFWRQLLDDAADVRIGNFQRDAKVPAKGFAKVANRSELWRPVANWLEEHSSSIKGKKNEEWEEASEPVPVVFAKCSLCTLLSADRSYVKGRYVLMGTFNDNWGMLANNRGDKIHHKQMLEMMLDPRCGRSVEDLEAFLADPRLVLWAVNHHVFRHGLHPRVISLPLGVKDADVFDGTVGPAAAALRSSRARHHRRHDDGRSAGEEEGGEKGGGKEERQEEEEGDDVFEQQGPRIIDRLLEVNNNEWKQRAELNRALNASFGGSLVNSYDPRFKAKTDKTKGPKSKDKGDRHNTSSSSSSSPPPPLASASELRAMQGAYLTRLSRSGFVLCPPGLGMDSYRVYEALLAGAVPVAERSPGLDRALRGLPVLLVDDLAARLAPPLLRHVYGRLARRQAAIDAWSDTTMTTTEGTTARSGSGSISSSMSSNGSPLRWRWRFEKLSSWYWVQRIRRAAQSQQYPVDDGDVDDEADGSDSGKEEEGREEEKEMERQERPDDDKKSSCLCWFPPGKCVDIPICRA